MDSPSSPFTVRVSASTSNLGPGFDLLGLALSLFLEVQIEGPSGEREHRWLDVEGSARDWPCGRTNLVTRALEAVAGTDAGGLRLRATSEIPLGRGLGSSGAAIAAGLLLGAALRDEPLDRQRLVDLGARLEGHPDNSTASLLGGCTLALPVDGGVRVVEQPVHPDIAFAVAWPAVQVSTQVARAALPEHVPFEDGVENARRLPLLLEGLRCADPELLRVGGEDRLHVPYRLPLIPGGEAALAAAREAGAWLATISGSGSTLIALCSKERAQSIADAMREVLHAAAGPAEGRVVEVVRERPRVRRE
jgi:homoserine kinase